MSSYKDDVFITASYQLGTTGVMVCVQQRFSGT